MANLYPFSVQAVYVASNNGLGVFGPAYMLESTKKVTASEKRISDRAQGNSKITSLAAQTISYELSLDTAGFDDEVLEILEGVQTFASNANTVLDVPNILMPYFGMIALTYPDDGDICMVWPYCKITGDWSYGLEFGKIVVPQFKCEAIEDPTLGYIWRKIRRPVSGGAISFTTLATVTP